jgi:hypothetical protein
MRVTISAYTILNFSGIFAFQVTMSTITIVITYIIMNSAVAASIANYAP